MATEQEKNPEGAGEALKECFNEHWKSASDLPLYTKEELSSHPKNVSLTERGRARELLLICQTAQGVHVWVLQLIKVEETLGTQPIRPARQAQ